MLMLPVTGEASALDPWVAVGDATLEVIADTTPVSSALPNSLQVSVSSDASGAVGASNPGYWGAHTFARTAAYSLIVLMRLGRYQG